MAETAEQRGKKGRREQEVSNYYRLILTPPRIP
jgi:hypothetical protein